MAPRQRAAPCFNHRRNRSTACCCRRFPVGINVEVIRDEMNRQHENQHGTSSLASKILLALIAFYQRHISSGLPARCRFYPTCSAYAAEAIRRHGAIRGSAFALWRILRCNPFCKGGYDPVPEKGTCVHRIKKEAL